MDVLDHARLMLAPHQGLSDLIAASAERGQWTAPLSDDTALPVAAWVDGALAREQTDVLVWAAAVGCGLRGGGGTLPVAARDVVVPVGAQAEVVCSAAMAMCEVATAAHALDEGEGVVFVDGGLVTSLVAIGAALRLDEGPALAMALDVAESLDLTGAIGGFVDGVSSGRVVALPKQDTATGYATLWSREWVAQGWLTSEQGRVLSALRDRLVIGGLLTPGQWVGPRPAVEVARAEAKVASMVQRARTVGLVLDDAFTRLAASADPSVEDGVRVMYLAPRLLPGRLVKVEAAGGTDHLGRVCALVDSHVRGPRIREPFGQHQVDALCKRAVTGRLSALTARARRAFPQAAVSASYRT